MVATTESLFCTVGSSLKREFGLLVAHLLDILSAIGGRSPWNRTIYLKGLGLPVGVGLVDFVCGFQVCRVVFRSGCRCVAVT
jgi:hypothetical protein